MRAGKTADLGSTGARREGGINDIDVEREIEGLATEALQNTRNGLNTGAVEFFAGQHVEAVFAAKGEVVFGIDLSAQTCLQHEALEQQAFLNRATHGGSV